MPYYRTETYTTNGTKGSLNLDPSIVPFNANVVCTLVSGTVDYKMQYSLTPYDVADASAIWADSTDIPASTSTTKTSFIQSPVSRIRLVIATISGTLTLQVQQGLSTN